MEQGKATKPSSSSSFTELFGSKVSPSSTSTILDSIFPPKPKVPGLEFLVAKKQDSSPNEPLNAKPGNSGEFSSVASGEVDSIYPQQCIQPCSLSSSIYYGGQDICPLPQTKKKDSVYKDEGEDDSEYASRGNWWQGSLYY
ncbi:Salt Induced Serine rich [Hibiscus trionum]|uniref:Salt Induced Serine rich n=1 Tax=Hibiscus trionum TaxID=183268 RepID=A0A9W7IXM8_HIBTR|nr:Salt Induced Serine rich [Hibiscus trionum]